MLGLRSSLVGKWVHHHLDSLFFQVNINLCTRHHRVAIIMDYAWLTAGDMELLAAERLDLPVLVERLVEHVETYLRRLDYIEWFMMTTSINPSLMDA